MNTQDPLAGLDGVRTYQERVMVRAVRLTRDNADAIAKIARKAVSCTDYGLIYLTGPGGVATIMSPSIAHTPTDFRAWYSHAGARISEEELA